MALRKASGAATRRLRRLDTPRRIRVTVDAEERPSRVAGSRRVLAVEAILESWRIDDEWWRTPISRRYFTVVLEEGTHLTLYHDLVGGGWYAHTGGEPAGASGRLGNDRRR
ncbi:MAG: hypothetical protein RQ745_10050 [Longimicrobiales bacterium]|nr:hypothetical protein [Longimicrobiales bacterium]